MEKKVLQLIPFAGLGNRMRVISSVYNFCKCNDIQLEIFWHREFGLNSSFSSLFDITVIEEKGVKVHDCSIIDFFYKNTPSKYNLFIPTIFDKCFQRNAHYFLGLNQLSENKIIGKTSIISTCSQQFELYPLKNLFKPKKELQDVIDEYVEYFGENTVGMHIRRTDNQFAQQKSTLEKFEEKIQSLFSESSTIKIFLCTDDPIVKNNLIKKYGNRIITYKSTLNRYSVQGIKDAVIELFLLSHTKKIYGSYYSSFTEMASSLGGIEYIIVQ